MQIIFLNELLSTNKSLSHTRRQYIQMMDLNYLANNLLYRLQAYALSVVWTAEI